MNNSIKKGVVVAVILLFISVSVIPSTGTMVEKKSTMPTFYDGNTLYVGGNGSGNYTKIQDAIDNASDGDTVFVFDDSSPYYENIIVDKSINLIGENRDTTVIDGSGDSYVVNVDDNWVNISGFTIRNSHFYLAGIDIVDFDHITITGNIILNNGMGIGFLFSDNNTIKGNNILNNKYYGICLDWSISNTITGNNISNNEYGICNWFKSDRNTITDNNISNNVYGIYIIIGCEWNTIRGNEISSNNIYGIYGIYLSDSSNNNIIDNNISNNRKGIYLYDSSNISVLGNSFFNNGLFVDDSYHNTVENNTVNSKPLVYLEDETDYIVTDAGQVVLVNCDNITAENLNLSNADVGIELLGTDNSKIRNNDCTNNLYGIYLGGSSSNTITGNTISNNDDGIRLSGSSNNIITGNNITLNWDDGIYLYWHSYSNTITGNNISKNRQGINLHDYSTDNTITGNNISSNNYDGIELHTSYSNTIMGNNISNNMEGIELWYSSSNTITGNNITSNNDYGIYLKSSSDNNIIYHNNLINNDENAYDECNNTWDDGEYGNYWSDYEERYPDAKKKWLKDIWNTPYEIPGGDNKDMCPLIKQWPKPLSFIIAEKQSIQSNLVVSVTPKTTPKDNSITQITLRSLKSI